MRKVLWLPAAQDGCGFFRMMIPHLHYPGSGYIQCTRERTLDPHVVQQYDVMVVQRQSLPGNYKAMEFMRAQGKRVIYDLDDNFWHVPRYNPAARWFSQPSILRCMERCLQLASHITVSTPHLVRAVARRIKTQIPITVVENAIDFSLFARVRHRAANRDGRITIGWAGTLTHEIDYQQAFNALGKIMARHADVHCEFWGGQIPGPIARGLQRGVGRQQVHIRGWVPVYEYPAFLSCQAWDIVLAPLQDNEFNRSKSWLKMIEAGALHLPCLASDVAEYRRLCQEDERLAPLLCRTEQDWEDKLEWLVSERAARVDLGEALYERVAAHHTIDRQMERWRAVMEGD